MPSFSGVHGTTSKHVANIQKFGFLIDSAEEYTRMFGNGIYMYKNDENGKLYAREWAKSKITNGNGTDEYACILLVDFSFNDNEHITWSEEEEMALEQWLNREKMNISPDKPLTRKIQNKYRLHFVSAAAERMSQQYKVIFAYMPFPKHLSQHGKKRYSACAVKNSCILPQPPYSQEGYSHDKENN